jgi:hypothetical protein
MSITISRAVILVELVICSSIFTPISWSQTNGNSATSPTIAANNGETANLPASDLKPSSSDEGQLATVKDAKIPSYAKVYVAPMLGGFENYIIAGLRNKKVPLVVMVDRTKAEYEISGVSESEKAGWAKMLFVGSQNSNEQASIKIADLKTGAVIFGYSVHKTNSARGRQSAGEACAKHIKQIVLE